MNRKKRKKEKDRIDSPAEYSNSILCNYLNVCAESIKPRSDRMCFLQ